eukprot:SAG31_NODE_2282_length_6017_cov_16.322237_3_plen_209_part_00
MGATHRMVHEKVRLTIWHLPSSHCFRRLITHPNVYTYSVEDFKLFPGSSVRSDETNGSVRSRPCSRTDPCDFCLPIIRQQQRGGSLPCAMVGINGCNSQTSIPDCRFCDKCVDKILTCPKAKKSKETTAEDKGQSRGEKETTAESNGQSKAVRKAKKKKKKKMSRNPGDDSKGLEVPKNVSGINLRLFSTQRHPRKDARLVLPQTSQI